MEADRGKWRPSPSTHPHPDPHPEIPTTDFLSQRISGQSDRFSLNTEADQRKVGAILPLPHHPPRDPGTEFSSKWILSQTKSCRYLHAETDPCREKWEAPCRNSTIEFPSQWIWGQSCCVMKCTEQAKSSPICHHTSNIVTQQLTILTVVQHLLQYLLHNRLHNQRDAT